MAIYEVDPDTYVGVAGQALPGDELRFMPGLYTVGLHVTRSGQLEAPIRMVAADAGNPPVIRSNGQWWFDDVAHWDLDGLVFDGSARVRLGYQFSSRASNIAFLNCVWRHSTANGIEAHNVLGLTVERCHFRDIRSRVAGRDRVALGLAYWAQDVTIRDCDFEDVGSDGVHILSQWDSDPGQAQARNILIDRCRFWVNRPYGSRSWHDFADNVGENGIDVKFATGGVMIQDSVVHGFLPSTPGQDASGSHGVGIVVHDGAANVTIEGGEIYACTTGVSLKRGNGERGLNIKILDISIHDCETGIIGRQVDGLEIRAWMFNNLSNIETYDCTNEWSQIMATLTDQEKTKIRQTVARKAAEHDVPIGWVKGAINDAAQAVEDHLVDQASAISTEIDTATSPYGITFTNQEKKWIVALVMEMKYTRDIIG